MPPKVYRNITPLTATELTARYFSLIVSPHAAIIWLPDATKNRSTSLGLVSPFLYKTLQIKNRLTCGKRFIRASRFSRLPTVV